MATAIKAIPTLHGKEAQEFLRHAEEAERNFKGFNNIEEHPYCFRKTDDPTKIVCTFTVSNDSIRIYDLPRSRKDYMKSLTHHEKPLRRYPGVLIGRLGVNKDFCGKGIGSEVIDFIKGWFMSHDNKSGCRFVIVDAINAPEVISFYQKNGFQPLFSSEEQEFLYTGGKKGQPVKMMTRLMYFDLLWMRQ